MQAPSYPCSQTWVCPSVSLCLAAPWHLAQLPCITSITDTSTNQPSHTSQIVPSAEAKRSLKWMRKYGTKWHGPQSSVSLLLTPVCKAERESAFASLTASAELALSWRAALHHPEAARWAPWVASDPLESVLATRRELLVLTPLREQLCWQLPRSPWQHSLSQQAGGLTGCSPRCSPAA